MLKQIDKNFIEIILQDIQYLKKEWGENVDDATLRRGSTILRRLLVNNDLQKAWKLLGFEKSPLIESVSLQKVIKNIPIQKVELASAGGGKYKGLIMAGALAVESVYFPRSQERQSHPPTETLGLHSFLKSNCLIVKGQVINRRQLINYVANKLGGAHFDSGREGLEEGNFFSLLDKAMQFKFVDKDPVYFELLSIGQVFVASKDIDTLCEKAHRLLSDR